MRYEYICSKCSLPEERDIPLSNYKEVQYCTGCGLPMDRVMSSPQFKVNGFNASNGYASVKPKKPPGY